MFKKARIITIFSSFSEQKSTEHVIKMQCTKTTSQKLLRKLNWPVNYFAEILAVWKSSVAVWKCESLAVWKIGNVKVWHCGS